MRPRVLGALVGDILHEPNARVKYGLLFAALRQRVELQTVYDANLRGWPRLLNALQVFHPRRARWRQNFYHNVPAFGARTRAWQQAIAHLPPADVILQEGVLFDASGAGMPVVIYTDYTDRLLQRQPRSGRLYLSTREHDQWIALESAAYRRAAHVCVRSQLVRRSLIEDYGLAPEKVSTIGGGVNFDPLPTPGRETTQAAPTVLFIGKDFHRKGGDLVLQAFAQARSRVPQARLRLLTAGPIPADLPRAGVEVIPPTWDRAEIRQLYQAADLLILPSRLETWGDVLLEAMAFGLPCLGVTGQAMDDLIEPGRTGLLAPPEDAAALARHLITLLTDPGLCQTMGRTAQARVAENFTWTQVAARLHPILEQAAFQRVDRTPSA